MSRYDRAPRRVSSEIGTASARFVWRERVIGAVLITIIALLGLGLFSHRIPDGNQFFGTISRIADSMRPWLLCLAILLSSALAWLRAWRTALLACLVAALGLGAIAVDYRARSAGWARDTDLEVLWFNILGTNRIAPERLELALRNADADIVVIGEALPAYGMKARLADRYPHSLGCRSKVRCEVLILSRHALTNVQEGKLLRSTGRLYRFTVTPEGGHPVDVVATHLIKPWYLSIALEERGALSSMLKRDGSRPLVMMGDLNAAPWSRRVRRLEAEHGLRHPPRPIGTWPTALGNLGVPIDHMLVRGGARFAWQEPWGDDLGSNHRGLLAGIAVPDPAKY